MLCKSPTIATRLRRAIELAVLLAMAVAVLRTWFLEGFPAGCQVSGASMAETLLGRHRDVVCADCGHRFPCDANGDAAAWRAVCPNCGYAGNRVDDTAVVAGDRVLVDRSVFFLRPPRRWEVVALRRPGKADALYVKRVVGLPRESIQIRHGSVFANGQIVRKTLSQQRAVAILVHDARQHPTLEPLPPPRWQAQHRPTAWDTAGGRFLHAAAPDPQPVDWLVYHHGYRRADRPDEVVPAPVTDFCSYDEGRPRREEDVHAVAGLMLSLRVAKASGPGLLLLWATDGEAHFRVEIDPAQKCYRVLQDGRPLPGAAGQVLIPPAGLKIEVSLFDEQFLLALGGQTVVTCPYERPERAPAPPEQPLAIGVGRLAVDLEEVRVWRDVYYTEPVWAAGDGRWGEAVQLGEGEYFVLGDNSPVSNDSRTWAEGAAVGDKYLIGKPLAIVLPARSVRWGAWHFQVPDLTRIRYIR